MRTQGRAFSERRIPPVDSAVATGDNAPIVDEAEIEGEAMALLRSAGHDPEGRPRMVALAHALDVSVQQVYARQLRGDAELVRMGDGWRVCLRARLPMERARFALAHEIAEWWLKRQGYDEWSVEHNADRFAGALVAPASRVTRVLRCVWSLAEFAAGLGTTESCAALRFGEVTGEPIALVAPRVRTRGEEWCWPSELELRKAVRGTTPAGTRRVELSDPRRVLLRPC